MIVDAGLAPGARILRGDLRDAADPAADAEGLSMRNRILWLAVAVAGAAIAGPAGAAGQQALRDRCTAAIDASGHAPPARGLEETVIPLGEQGFLFQFSAGDGGTYSCQVCDDDDPAAPCGSMGLQLSFRPADGELVQLPAELERKCKYFLQKEVKPRSDTRSIDHAMVARIQSAGTTTESRIAYAMQLDGGSFRCVIRRSDGSFRVERQEGAEWRPIAAGVLW